MATDPPASHLQQSATSKGRRSLPLTLGFLALAILVFLPGNAIISLMLKSHLSASDTRLFDAYVFNIASFSMKQAFLSAAFSCFFGLLLAQALFFSGPFKGRDILLKFFSLTLVMPTIIAVIGMIAVHGSKGWVNEFLSLIGLELENRRYFSGLTGILIAHAILNIPIATRIILMGYNSISAENWRLARSYNLNGRTRFIYMEWPVLQGRLINAFMLIFLLCFVSFAIIITIGGNPAFATLETAIYQAIKFEFDLERAAALSVAQIGLCAVIILLTMLVKRDKVDNFTLTLDIQHTDLPPIPPVFRLWCYSVIIILTIFIITPFAALIVKAFSIKGLTILGHPGLWEATFFSLTIAFAATLLFIALLSGLSIVILWGQKSPSSWHRRLGNLTQISGQLILVFPPYVTATGLFILVTALGGSFALGPYLVVIVNAVMALPYGLAILLPALKENEQNYGQLADQLHIMGLNRLRHVIWPNIKKPAGLTCALAFCLSLGDLGVIALFGSHNFSSLPLYIFRLAGAYKLEEAIVAAVFLLFLFFACFWVIERMIGRIKC